MNSEEILKKIKAIIVEQFGINEENIKEDSTFIDDLGADSLDIVELIMSIEEEFDIEIPDNKAEQVVAVRDVVKYIQENK